MPTVAAKPVRNREVVSINELVFKSSNILHKSLSKRRKKKSEGGDRKKHEIRKKEKDGTGTTRVARPRKK